MAFDLFWWVPWRAYSMCDIEIQVGNCQVLLNKNSPAMSYYLLLLWASASSM